MAINDQERRFLKHWEEQRKDGKKSFIITYSIGLCILIFIVGIALALFTSLQFVYTSVLLSWVSLSVIGGISLSFIIWKRQQKRFGAIIRRELQANR